MIAKLIKVIFRESKGVRTGIIINVLCGCITVALSLLVVWSTREIVSAACDGNREKLTATGVMFCLFLAGRILTAKFGQRLEAWCITRMSNVLRSRLFHKVMMGGYNVESDLHSADVVNRLSADVGNLSSTVCSTVPALIVSAVSFICAFVYLAVLAPVIAIIVAALMPVAILTGKLPAAKTYRLSAGIRDAETDIFRQLQDNVSHKELITTIGYSDRASEEFHESQNRFFRLTMQRNDLGLIAGGAVTFGFMAGYAVMFLYCAYGLLDSTVSFATMTALLQLTAMVQRPVVDMSHKITPFVKAAVSADRIEALELQYCKKPDSVIKYGENIAFKNVWFRYNDASAYILKAFDDTIPVGKVTALYGETGKGKTTILRLLLGLYQPREGEIYSPFAGCNSQNIIYVPQGNSLLSGTVETNLLMGNPDASLEDIGKALYLADAEFIWQLPDGVMTKCGENGYGFSEGQAQRLAIARGIIRFMRLKKEKKSPIMLLMDEPTSALDPETEATMLDRTISYCKGETIVIVTHKNSIRKYADKVIVI